jgi:phage/plasmid-like protein (TIGR03299 family)
MTTTIGPNAAFTAERQSQQAAAVAARDAAISRNADRVADFDTRVADGKLKDLGNGRFRVTDPNSWDNNEVLQLRLTEFGPMIQPVHNLDETAGRVALFSRTPAWHELGTVVTEGLTSIPEILKAGGIDFQVATRPVLYQPTMGDDVEARPLDDMFVTVRSDTGAGLGVVGKIYTPIQNAQAFAFMQELLDLEGEEGALAVESAGALYGGKKVFITMRLPRTITVDPEGVNDPIVPFIVCINSHDGRSQFTIVATPWRVECGNTERFALEQAVTRWSTSHTTNAKDRVNEARRTLRLSNAYYEEFAADQGKLARTPLTLDQFRTMVDITWADRVPELGATTRKVNNHTKHMDTLVGMFEDNATRLGFTAYAGERAVTYFSDWARDIRPTGLLKGAGNQTKARACAALDGADDERKSTAHRHLMTLVRK